jgi:hypothetical protein
VLLDKCGLDDSSPDPIGHQGRSEPRPSQAVRRVAETRPGGRYLAGDALIGRSEARLCADSRYWLRADRGRGSVGDLGKHDCRRPLPGVGRALQLAFPLDEISKARVVDGAPVGPPNRDAREADIPTLVCCAP